MNKALRDDIKYAKINALMNYLSYFINVLLGFIINPLLLKYLGSNDFGILKTIQKYLGFATVADGRATQSLKWVIAKNRGLNNISLNKQAVGSALFVWKIFLPILVIVISIIVLSIPKLINDLPASYITNVRVLSILLGFNIILGSLLGIPDSVLVGTNQGFRSIIVNIVWMIIANVVMVFIVYKGYGIIGIGAVTVVFSLIRGVNILYVAKRKVRWFGVEKPVKKELVKFIHFSGWTLSWVFISKILLSSEVILLGYLMGGESVTNYVFSSYFAVIAITISAMLTSSFTPTLGSLFGQGDTINIERIVEMLREGLFWISVFCGGLILLFNKTFLSFWVGADHYVGGITNFIIVILMIQLILIRNEAFIINVSTKIKNKVVIGLLSVLLSLSFAYWFSFLSDNKLNGILLGLFTGRIIMFFAFPFLVSRELKIPIRIINNNFTSIFFAVVLLIITFFIGKNIQITKVISFILILVPSIIMYGIITFKLLITQRNQKLVFKMFLRVINK